MEKEAWLKKIDNILARAHISEKQNGQMIATGDFNIILLSKSIETVKYSEILKHCDLIQHKIIDQISWNLTRVTSQNDHQQMVRFLRLF